MTTTDPRNLPRSIAAVALGAGVVLVFVLGAGRPLWLDEAFGAWVAQKSFAHAIAAVTADSAPPLYYLALAGWSAVFGFGEVALRSFSLVCLLAAGLLLHRLARAIEPASAFPALVVFLSCQTCLRHAQNARMYALLLVLVVVSMHVFLVLVRGNRRFGVLLALGAVTAAGLLTHYWFAFVVLAQGIAALAWFRSALVPWCLAVAAGGGAFAAIWGRSLWRQLHSGATAWMLPPDLAELPRTFGDWFGGPWFAAMAVALLLLAMVWRGHGAGNSVARALAIASRALVDARGGPLLVLLAAVTVVPWVVSQWQPTYFVGRSTVVGAVPLALLAGILLRGADRRVALAAGVAFAATMLAIAPRDQQLHVPGDDRATAVALLERCSPGDAVVFTSLSRAGLEYYLWRMQPGHGLRLASFPRELEEHPGWRDFSDADATEVQASTAAMLAAIEGWRRDGCKRVWLVHGFAPDEPFVVPLLVALHHRHRAVPGTNAPGLFYNRIDGWAL